MSESGITMITKDSTNTFLATDMPAGSMTAFMIVVDVPSTFTSRLSCATNTTTFSFPFDVIQWQASTAQFPMQANNQLMLFTCAWRILLFFFVSNCYKVFVFRQAAFTDWHTSSIATMALIFLSAICAGANEFTTRSSVPYKILIEMSWVRIFSATLFAIRCFAATFKSTFRRIDLALRTNTYHAEYNTMGRD